MRHAKLVTALLAAALAAAVLAWNSGIAAAQSIVVGGKNYTEQELMAEMTARLLRASGFAVDKRSGMGSAPVRQAQESGQIDLYWEYTGTSLITFNKVTDKLDAASTYAKVRELDAAKGLVWLNPSKANNTYAIAMRSADAAQKGIASISDLAQKAKGGQIFRLGSTAEFFGRPDGLRPMEAAYGFEFGNDNVVRMASGLIYQALRDSQVDVGVVFATDGRVPAFNFKVLADDKGYFPTYAMTAVVRKDTLEKNPRLAEILNALSAKLDDQTMAKLNSLVDVDKKTIEDVASGFLTSQGLI